LYDCVADVRKEKGEDFCGVWVDECEG